MASDVVINSIDYRHAFMLCQAQNNGTPFRTAGIIHSMARHDIGMRLRHARKLRGLTQQELAKRSGVKQASISDLERGESKSFRGTTLVSLAQTLQVNQDWLSQGKGAMDRMEDPLPPEALRVARNWLRLAPEVRVKIADMLKTMADTAETLVHEHDDEPVTTGPGRPHHKGKK
jgi:transcriptional regulator with XRE-family HTH domain